MGGHDERGIRKRSSEVPENRHSEKSWEAYVDTSSQYDEFDPALAELEFAMDQAQFTHLQALEDSVNEAAWGAHLAAYAPGSDATDGSGGGIIEPGFGTTTSPEAAARTRRQEVALNRLIQKVKREAREREENLEKRAAAAATYVQRDTVAGSQTVGDRADGDESADTSNEITPTSWWERRQLGGYSSEFEGYGYGTTISQYALAKAFTAPERSTSSSQRRKSSREFRLVAGEPFYLAFEAFTQRDAVATTNKSRDGSGGACNGTQVPTALPASKCLTQEVYSAVDSGTTLTIMDLPGGTFVGYNKNNRLKIAGFNGSVSKSRGSGTVIGFAQSTTGNRVDLRIPNVHSVVGAPNDLLSVSGMVRLGYSFHFTPERSYVVTPELEILELLEKSGLYWLKWHRAVDPASAREQKHTMTCTRQTEDPSDEAADELSTIELPGQEKRGFHPDWKVETVGDHPDQKVETVGVHPDRKVETVGSIQIVAAAADQTGDRGDLSACDFCGATHQPGVPLSLLHRRLAHWNQDSIEKMVKNQSLDVKLTSKARCACEICLTNKATRRHVSTEREQEADVELPFERVWTDVKGKVIPDLYGNPHMITFTCEV